MILFLDYETWSSVHIRRGTDVYVRHCRPVLLSWAVDDGPVGQWNIAAEPGAVPAPLRSPITNPDVCLVAHNAFFDRHVMWHHGFSVPIHRWWDTQAQAQAHGLPGGLGNLCVALGLPRNEQKDAEGKRLIRMFCGPKTPYPAPDEIAARGLQTEWEQFREYAKQDIISMRAAYRKMPQWNYAPGSTELALWHKDQEINDRGFGIDIDFARAAVDALKEEKQSLNDETYAMTNGEVEAATQRQKLLDWLRDFAGVILPNLQASTINEALNNEYLDEGVKDLLRVRLQSSKASTAKFRRLLETVGADNRLRGTLNFAGASRTARWSGRIFQPHNLPRPSIPPLDVEFCIGLIKDKQNDLVKLFDANLSRACSNSLRGLIVAAPGRKLVVADLANIEGRCIAWLAGEDWKLKAFAEYDKGVGHDLYILAYARAFNIDPADITGKDPRRQIGKIMELALGYQGGVGAFVSMAGGANLEDIGRAVKETAPEEVYAQAQEAWGWAIDNSRTLGLDEEVYVGCDALKRLWRQAHPHISRYWYMLQDAAIKAITERERVQVGACVFDCNGTWMRIMLPSGRFLVYPLPKVHSDGKTISHMAYQMKRWKRIKTYGGKLCENITQAVARDFLADSMLRAERANLPIVLHVHDEIVAEVPESNVDALSSLVMIMTTSLKWAAGIPLAAEGFEAYRYRKD